jgi:glucose/arabinose dehydrogenase
MEMRAKLATSLTLSLCVVAVAAASTGAATSHSLLGTGYISTVAGTGAVLGTGDGGPAKAARMVHPNAVAVLPDGSFLISDYGNHRIRRVSTDGTITTVAGTGTYGFSGDGGPATAARINNVSDIAALPDGSFLIDDFGNNRVRRVSTDGTITTVAGTGSSSFSGDGGPATGAGMSPYGIAVLPGGGFLIADLNDRVREVSPSGTITTVAGTGTEGYGGDGLVATSAKLNNPGGVAALPDGGFLIADSDNNRIRKVASNGLISTVAGNGGYAPCCEQIGDGSAAVGAALESPTTIAVVPGGGFLIADFGHHRIRSVHPGFDGGINTVAGTTKGFSGDGKAAIAAKLDYPQDVAVIPGGGFLIADSSNNRVRIVCGPGNEQCAATAEGCLPGVHHLGPVAERTYCGKASAQVTLPGHHATFHQGSCRKTSDYFRINIGTLVSDNVSQHPAYFELVVGKISAGGTPAGHDGKFSDGAFRFVINGVVRTFDHASVTLKSNRTKGTFSAPLVGGGTASGTFSCS